MAVWDPATYLQFADERSRPFFDLVRQVKALRPSSVVDLGCGPGQLTAALTERWPEAGIVGVDSSPEMITRAGAYANARLSFLLADLRDWQPDSPVEVILSNAALQWVPGHRDLLPRMVGALVPGGWLAFQVPGNFAEPSHRLLHELADDHRFAGHLADVEWPAAFDAATYLDDLARLGCTVDAWETTYLHVLTGPHPVFRWISGTGARPVLQALPETQREEFVAEYQTMLEAAYPAQPYGTVLPFRRVFVVAQRVPR
jgi:trans-aconitate 2-methyltransferase